MPETEAEPEPEPNDESTVPERQAYILTITRQIELDLNPLQIEMMKQRHNAETSKEAIEQSFIQRELDSIEPEQKLTALKVDAETPNDDPN